MPVARYDAIADFYVQRAPSLADDSVARSLLDLLPVTAGARVLDLACGHGRLAIELARRGAQVTGLDISEALLGRARAAATAHGIHVDWRVGDATARDALAGETFDGVVCHFGLTDIDDLDALIGTVSRLLRSGGWFAFSILHPCFPGWGGDAPSSWRPGSGYFSEAWWLAENTGFRGRVGSTHRMLATYLNALIDHGLRMDRVAEPTPTGEWLHKNDSDDLVPTYLVIRCTREP